MKIESGGINNFGKCFAFLALIIGLYITAIQVMGTGLEKVPGDFGDARFNNFILEHCYQFFTGQVSNFWDGRFMYPEKNVISYSDNLLGTAPIYAVFRLLNFSRETAFQLWIIALWILNYTCALWVFYKWSGKFTAAAVGAYIFAFSIAIYGQINYAQCFPRFPIPLAFYWLHLFFSKGNFKHLLYCSLAIVFQFYAGVYLGLFLLLAIGLFAICGLFIFKNDYFPLIKKNKIKSAVSVCVILILFALLLVPLMLPYVERAKISGARGFEEGFPTIPHLKSYLFCYPHSFLWKPLESIGLDLPIWWNHLLFPGIIALAGIPTTLILLVVLKFKNSKIECALLFSLLLLFLLTTNFSGFTLYKYVYKIVPGYNSMRVIGRVINIELFFLASFVVLLIAKIKFKNAILQNVLFPVLLALLIVDNKVDGEKVIHYYKAESQMQINRLAEKIKVFNYKQYKAAAFTGCDSSYYSSFFQIDGMLACQQVGIPSVNGYSATGPPAFFDFFNFPNETTLNKWLFSNNKKSSDILIVK